LAFSAKAQDRLTLPIAIKQHELLRLDSERRALRTNARSRMEQPPEPNEHQHYSKRSILKAQRP